MNDLNTYWERRKNLIAECHRCEESNRFLLLAIPLYIVFPVFLLFVIPLFILFRRIRYLAMVQLKKDQEKFCTIISGGHKTKPARQPGSIG